MLWLWGSVPATPAIYAARGNYLIIVLMVLVSMVNLAEAQNSSIAAQASTAPWEAKAINSVFMQWGVKADTTQWNLTGDPCTGKAVDNVVLVDSPDINPFIKCDCTFDNNTTCHITALKVYTCDAAGVLPDELWHLTYLTKLDLRQNILNGPISPSIGNLTRLRYLSFGTNGFTGTLPRELGKLSELRSLSVHMTNLSGRLPPELGNLAKLEQLYISSSGLSGEVPSTFAKLTNLATLWASDIGLTGNIPDFIGNWTKLTALRLEGNKFTGPIPSSFSNLISLQDLRVSDLSNGSSTLAFLKDLKSLNILVLSNNNISESVPSYIGDFKSLSHLDLSFNRIFGHIPESLLNLSSLRNLFLGNNKLIGSLPNQKSQSLQIIDVSYNELTGTFPSWVDDDALQLNFVGNNLTVTSSKGSALPQGLNCLQRTFPCFRGSPRYYSFAINCGGQKFTSSDQTLYDMDNEALGPATYFVGEGNRWAISSSGSFLADNNTMFTKFSPRQITNTLDPTLFQTARLSPGSLRYYGLGLENGNYTVLLQFAELQFENTQSWESHGRRVFDIYIQGDLESKDFDIHRETGGLSFIGLQKNFTAQVKENYLEIHLFWAGRGTCCVPSPGTYGPIISAVKVNPNFVPTVSNKPPRNHKKIGIILGIAIPFGILGILFFAICCFIKRRSTAAEVEEHIGVGARLFSYAELKSATGDFSSANKLGQGAFGYVYKGTLKGGRVAAVKELSIASHLGKSQFVAEIAAISAVQHHNLVRLYGCCFEKEKCLLVYEYLEKKSLDQALFGNNAVQPNWTQRFKICMGVAKGLAYLHEESSLRIVHKDVKARNILLDTDENPKISDFCLSKLYTEQISEIITPDAGTVGYLGPEYFFHGHITEKADVFAFGVVALEIISGRAFYEPSLEKEKMLLLKWAWHLYENCRHIDLVDERLSDFNAEEVKRILDVAFLCTQKKPLVRPSMSKVVGMLSGDIELNAATLKPAFLNDHWGSRFTATLKTS